MDYSLLIGVQRQLFPLSPQAGDCVHACAVEGPGRFYLGLIDLLQTWTWGKWLEFRLKTLLLRLDGRGISAVEPGYYRQRFMQRAVVDVFHGLHNLSDIIEEENSEDEEDALYVGSRGSIGLSLTSSSGVTSVGSKVSHQTGANVPTIRRSFDGEEAGSLEIEPGLV
jgi:hypothetical protein